MVNGNLLNSHDMTADDIAALVLPREDTLRLAYSVAGVTLDESLIGETVSIQQLANVFLLTLSVNPELPWAFIGRTIWCSEEIKDELEYYHPTSTVMTGQKLGEAIATLWKCGADGMLRELGGIVPSKITFGQANGEVKSYAGFEFSDKHSKHYTLSYGREPSPILNYSGLIFQMEIHPVHFMQLGAEFIERAARYAEGKAVPDYPLFQVYPPTIQPEPLEAAKIN